MRYGVEVAIGDYPKGAVRIELLIEAASAENAKRAAEDFVKAGPVQAISAWDMDADSRGRTVRKVGD